MSLDSAHKALSMESHAIHLSLLGSWQLIANGEKKREPRQKVKGLLAYLALEANQTHSREQLSALLWPEMGKKESQNNLCVTLYRLKKLMNHSDVIEASRGEVSFNTAVSHAIDVSQFETAVKKTERHDHASLSQCQACLADLETAVSLYRGEFLEGLVLTGYDAFAEWHFVWRERLHIMALKQLERLAKAMWQNGRFNRVEAYARRQIALDNLNEAGHRNLMRALYAQGQRTAALQQYEQCVALLAKELGVPPAIETEQLKTAVEQETLAFQPKHERTKPENIEPTNLPEYLTPFFGREEELALLAERLSQKRYRLISLVGPGGIGKTRLAIEAARRQLDHFADGVYFVSLVGVQTVHEIPGAISESIGISLVGAAPAAEQIVTLLANKKMLLLIDNLEHLMDGVSLLQTMLAQAPELTLLVTSRERLNIQSEDLFRLRGLPYPTERHDLTAVQYPAIRLFGDRAHRLKKQFWLNEDTLPHVVQICQAVEGLPLGLELAATWVRDLSVAEIAEGLEQDLSLLQTDMRDIDPRHRHIEAIFDYSWRLLSTEEQKILPLLTLFKGGFTQEAASAICNASPVVLKRLRYKTLIRGDGNNRYAVHELIRQIAARRLPTVLEEAKIRFVTYYLDLLKAHQPMLLTKEAREAAQQITNDIDNVRQAWQWAIALDEFKMLKKAAPALADYFIHTGYYVDGQGMIERAVAALPEHQHRERPFFLIEIAALLSAHYYGKLDELKRIIDEVLTLTEGQPEHIEIRARACLYLSRGLFANTIDSEQSQAYAEQAMVLARQSDSLPLIGDAYVQLGCLHYRYENTEAAVASIQEGLKIYESLGDFRRILDGTRALTLAYSESGNLIKTFELEKNLLALKQQWHSELGVADQYFNLSISYASFGDTKTGITLLLKAMDIYQKCNDKEAIQSSYAILGEHYYNIGDDERSIDYYRKAVALQEELKLTSRLCGELTGFSQPLQRSGLLDEAQQVLERAIEVGVAPRYVKQARAHLACVLMDKGQNREALLLAEPLWQEVKSDGAKSLPSVLRTLRCFHQLFVAADKQAEIDAILKLAHREIQKTVDGLNDPTLRQSYLNNQSNVHYFKSLLAETNLTIS